MVYTGSELKRNLFRSTAYHNTVRIDNKEISEHREGELFSFISNVRPRVISWKSDEDRDVLDAEHDAYSRLERPVTHRRIVTLEKKKGYWLMRDIFTGQGRHRFEFCFNFDAGLKVSVDELNNATASDDTAALTITPVSEQKLEAKIESRWVSLAYGIRLNSSAIIYSLMADTPVEVSFKLQPAAPLIPES